jgi:hypothetical protein
MPDGQARLFLENDTLICVLPLFRITDCGDSQYGAAQGDDCHHAI